MVLLILPNQLFDKKYIDKTEKIVIWECPHYFCDYNYNKKKLVLHRASMKYYEDYLKSYGYNVEYIGYNKNIHNEDYIIYNPLNKLDVLKLPLKTKVNDISTPNLMLSISDLKEYCEKTDKYFFNAFYMWSKKKLNIIPDVKSQDKYNRKVLKNNTSSTQITQVKQPFEEINLKIEKVYISEAISYVNKNFPKNCGNTDNFIFPITHYGARKWLDHFIRFKFKLFGDYQDYIDKTDNYLYHSMLSSLINIGLLNPGEIIKEIEKYQSVIPLNSYEGFVRQLFWREYQYYCYINVDFSSNYFNNKKHLTDNWYNGTTGILPVDDAIKEAFDTGYLHHIKRLMVVGNYMNLSGIQPKEGFKWFMEFSCDSYEWVMHQNVYDMVFFVTNGKTMRRPYISSSNYILKMSNYKKDKWSDIWDTKYKNFINKNKKKLYKYRYYFSTKNEK